MAGSSFSVETKDHGSQLVPSVKQERLNQNSVQGLYKVQAWR